MGENPQQMAETMRKYLYLITDHPDSDLVGNVEFAEKPALAAEKNTETARDKRNRRTGEEWTEMIVSLGHADFDSQEDYESRMADVAESKLKEIDDDHLRKAGIDDTELYNGDVKA
jgi:hypothetical protein